MEQKIREREPEAEKTGDIVFLGGEPELQEVAEIEKTCISRIPVEVNIKRNSNLIFPHHRIKNLDKKRIFKLQSGELVIIPSVDEKAPTTSSLRFFIAFLYIGYLKQCQTNRIPFSSRELAKLLRRSWNGGFARQIYREMRSLAMTTFEWKQSFETMTGTKTSLSNFHLINAFDYEDYRQRLEGETRGIGYKDIQFKASYSVEINKSIWDSFKSGKISFANLETLLSFKSGIAEVFYLRIDTILCSNEYIKKHLELRSENIIKGLQLDDVIEYRQVLRRKRVLVAIKKECDEKTLSNGNTLKVDILQTADGKDWKLRCYQLAKALPNIQKIKHTTDQTLIEYLADQITKATNQPENRRWHVLVAKSYPQNLIARALSELQQEPPENMRDKGAVFTAKLKTIVNNSGLPWLKSAD